MTGFGQAREGGVSVEVRAVNNRHLKLSVRGTDPYPQLEAEVEKVVRPTVRRGSVLVHVRVDRAAAAGVSRLNADVLAGYLRETREACWAAGLPDSDTAHVLAGVLGLPGVAAADAGPSEPPAGEWPQVEANLRRALAQLDEARGREGRAMAADLLALHRQVADRLAAVRDLLPRVMDAYRERLLARVRQAVQGAGVAVEPDHLIREVALFADRSDVSEEVSRLAAHLDQFTDLVRAGGEGAGRRLEFVVQEMGREVNTLGSKAGDVAVSREVVEMKAALEKVRELIQNVE
jgi:uncharacterized protein (TIGR00255 family)